MILKCALLGFGKQGNRLLSAVEKIPNIQVVSVYSRNIENAYKNLGSFKNDVHISNSLEEVINIDDVSAVLVSTPDFLHYQHAKLSLESGKHVYLEKPLSIFVEEGKNLIALSKKLNRTLYIGYHLRHITSLMFLQKLFVKGHFGKIKTFDVRWGIIPDTISNWRIQDNPWRCSSILGTHCIDLVLWFLKPVSGLVKNVKINFPKKKSNIYDEEMHIKIDFEQHSESIINCTLSQNVPLTLKITSEKGEFVYDQLLGNDGRVIVDHIEKKFFYENPWKNALSDFLDTIKYNRVLKEMHEDSLENIGYLREICQKTPISNL